MADTLFLSSVRTLRRVTFRFRVQRGESAVDAMRGLAFLFAQVASHG